MSRRPRKPTNEELSLWETATRDVRAVKLASADVVESTAAPKPVAPLARPAPVKKLPGKTGMTHLPLPTPQTRRGHVAGLDRTMSDRLKRGELTIDARLDLHGMRQHQAHQRLGVFVRSSHAMGHRTLLVITGKGQAKDRSDHGSYSGYDSFDRPGILREMLPNWLAEPSLRLLITAVVPAARKHGGAGAVYLYLRRQRGK